MVISRETWLGRRRLQTLRLLVSTFANKKKSNVNRKRRSDKRREGSTVISTCMGLLKKENYLFHPGHHRKILENNLYPRPKNKYKLFVSKYSYDLLRKKLVFEKFAKKPKIHNRAQDVTPGCNYRVWGVYSPKRRAKVCCVRLMFNISRLVYWQSSPNCHWNNLQN